MDACDMPFFPNAGNFTGFKEHDKNPRKFWFLVLSDGLFTKKCVSLTYCPLSLLTQTTAQN
jgi:hypothetical protein